MRGPNVATFRDVIHSEICMRINEARIDRVTLQLPNARSCQGLHVTPHLLDNAVTDHNGCVVQDLSRSGHYVVPDARYRFGPGRLLRLEPTGQQQGQAQNREECSHKIPIMEGGTQIGWTSKGWSPRRPKRTYDGLLPQPSSQTVR